MIGVLVKIAGSAAGLMSSLGEAEGAMAKFGVTAKGAMGAIGAGGGAAGIGTMISLSKGALQMAADYETAMNRIRIQTNATEQSLAMWESGMKSISSDTGAGIGEVANSMFMVASAGFQGADALQILDASIKGAKVSGGELADTSKILASMLDQWDLSGQNATGMMNGLVEATRLGHAEMIDMASGFKNVISMANATGVSWQEISAALAVMTNQLMNADSAGTHLSSTLRSMQFTTRAQQRALDEVGLSATNLANNLGSVGLKGTMDEVLGAVDTKYGSNLRGLTREMDMTGMSAEDLDARLSGMGGREGEAVQQLKRIFGTAQALRTVLALSGDSADEFAASIDSINAAAGNTSNIDGWADRQETLNARWEKFSNQVKLFLLDAGEQIMPWAEKAMDKLEQLKNWMDQNQGAVNVFADALKGALIVAAAGAAVALAGLVVAAALCWAIFELGKRAVEGVKTALKDFANVGDAVRDKFGQAGAAVLRFIEIATGLNGIFSGNNLGGGGEGEGGGGFMGSLGKWIDMFGKIGGVVKTGMAMINMDTTTGMAQMNGTINAGNAQAGMSFSSTWAIISTSVSAGMSVAVGAVSAGIGSMVATIASGLASALAAYFAWGASVVAAVSSAMSSAVGAARGYVGAFASVGSAMMQGLMGGIMSMAGSIASAAASVVRNALNAARSAVGIKSPSRDFNMQVGVPIGQGIAQGIAATQSVIDRAVADVTRHPLTGDYSGTGTITAGGGRLTATGSGRASFNGGGGPVNVVFEFNGSIYGDGGIRALAEQVRDTFLRFQRNGELGFAGSGSFRLG